MTPQQKKMVSSAKVCADVVREEIKDGSMKSPFKLIGECMAKEMRKGRKAHKARKSPKRSSHRKARKSRKGRKSRR